MKGGTDVQMKQCQIGARHATAGTRDTRDKANWTTDAQNTEHQIEEADQKTGRKKIFIFLPFLFEKCYHSVKYPHSTSVTKRNPSDNRFL